MSRLLLIILAAAAVLAVGCGEPSGLEPVPQTASQVLPTPVETQVSTAPAPHVPPHQSLRYSPARYSRRPQL